MNKQDRELNTLNVLANAVELAVALTFEVAGSELGEGAISEQGRDGIANIALSRIRLKNPQILGA